MPVCCFSRNALELAWTIGKRAAREKAGGTKTMEEAGAAQEGAKSELADHPAPADSAAPPPKKRRSAWDTAPVESPAAESAGAPPGELRP